MYQIYITDALVCGSRDNNTSDRSYQLFTREAGMVWAVVKSAREERSKHRYALQDFSLARVSLVRGKSGWRITGTESVRNLYFDATTREERTSIRNIVRLLRRFMHGETPSQIIYDDIVGTFLSSFLYPERVELVLALRILGELGYIAPSPSYQALMEAPSVHAVLETVTSLHESAGRRAIEHALAVSHL